MAPDWSSHFDAVYMLGYTGYKERVSATLAEYRRVGLRPNLTWQFPTPYDEVLRKNIKTCNGIKTHTGYLSCCMGHYRNIKTAYHLGAGSCLLLEDDARFLRDTDRISEALENMPADWDVVMLDIGHSVLDPWYEILQCWGSQRVNPRWHRLPRHPRSTACYGLSRRAMEHFIELYEAPVAGDAELCAADGYLDVDRNPGLNMYATYPQVCIQWVDPGSKACCSLNNDFEYYKHYWHLICNGIDLSQYNIGDVEEINGMLDVAERVDVLRRGPRG